VGLDLVGEGRDSCPVCSPEYGVAVNEEALARIEPKAGGSGPSHHLDGLDPNHGNVKTHVLLGLGDLDDGEVAIQSRRSGRERRHDVTGALDGGIGTFHGFDSNAGALRNDDCLADVVMAEGARDLASVSKPVEFSSTMPSSARTLEMAPKSESVLRVVSESNNLASRQSGRMLEKICLCFTCPAITARVMPSWWNVCISFDSSPSESQ